MSDKTSVEICERCGLRTDSPCIANGHNCDHFHYADGTCDNEPPYEMGGPA